MHDNDALIKRLPKCELHIHIEGSLEPELMFALAQRNGVKLAFDSIDAVRQAYQFRNLQDFLDIYYQGMSVLLTEQDFYDLALAYLRRARADNVRHVEMFFDPQGHTSRGVAFETVIGGLSRAIADAERQYGIRASLIMCFLRHLDEADAERTLDSALVFRDKILGIGLDSSRTTPAFFSPRMPVRKDRPAMCGRRSTFSASAASTTATTRSTTTLWSRALRASAWRSRCARFRTFGCASCQTSKRIRCGGCWTRILWSRSTPTIPPISAVM
jgi:hypothetical protein